MDLIRRYYQSAIVIAVILVGWQLSSSLRFINPLLLSSPLDIFLWIANNSFNPDLWADIGSTLRRVMVSFIISVIIGIPLGMLMGYFVKLEEAFRFPIDFGRSIPATALFPLFMLFLGVGEGSRVAAAIYGSSLIVLVNTISGVKQGNKNRIKTAKAYGASGWKLFFHVLLPEALPSVITGMRLGVSLAFVIIVLVEMFIGTTSGLGHRIIESQMLFEIPQMYGSIIIAGLFGYLFNGIFLAVERKVGHYVGH